MTISMYQASIPVFQRSLSNLDAILQKAAQHAENRKIDAQALLQARLFPDMFTFTRQVQIACDFAKGAAARLAGQDVPSWEDNEKSFEELRARVARTLEFVAQAQPEQIDGSEERDIQVGAGERQMKFKGQVYLLHFVLPNFYFHLTTAYDILRHNGVEIGKRDFIGQV
ncbi:DUF1993 domain-containing protein [Massilia sp. W12]|uniref:DUF1993 domain-containing protein n=1 Tax=Massilia sp. W12 TaxID=3126507 RepID=UPI0030CCAAD8